MEYKELDVWIEARKLVKEVYSATENFPKSEQIGLTSQIRRSVISIPSNIAEGVGRSTSKDTLRFLYIARGSVYELETQVYLSEDLGYVSEITMKTLIDQLTVNKKLLNGFINYYKKRS